MEVMGVAEVAARLGWSKQHVASYLRRAEEKNFPQGMIPRPCQRIAAGALWRAEDIEIYAKGRESEA